MSGVLKFAPRPGRPWAGGVFAGFTDGGQQLIVGPQPPEPVDWSSAIAWAAGLNEYGHCDFELPRVRELTLLAAQFPKFFVDVTPWWSCESHPVLDSDAFVLLDG